MSSYVRKKSIRIEFDGDSVGMDITRFNNEDMLDLGPYVFTDNEGSDQIKFDSGVKFNQIAVKLLPSRVSNFHGLKDASGADLSFEDVLGDPVAFMDLIMGIMGHIFQITYVSKVEVKKSEEPSGPSLLEPKAM